MESVEEIRKRLNKDNEPVKENKIIRFFNVLLVLCSLCLCGLIYCKHDENGELIKNLFNVEVSFKQFNYDIQTALNNLFKIEDNEEENLMVSTQDLYHNLGNNNYTTDDKTIPMLTSGTIMVSSFQEEYKYFVVVSYDNGVNALYTLVDSLNVEEKVKLNQKDIIGTYDGEYFNCVFKRGNQVISYNEAIN